MQNPFELMITKELILEKVDALDIFQFYIDIPLQLNKRIISPIREETNPSFCLYKNKYGQIYYKDFAGSQGSCFDLVMEMYSLTFRESVLKIANDFNIADDNESNYIDNAIKRTYVKSKPKKEYVVEDKGNMFTITPREWVEVDYSFWKDFGIDRHTLKEYGVIPIQKVVNNHKNYTIYESDCGIMYAYDYGNGRYKIYRPLLEGGKRFFGDTKTEDVFGLKQIKLSKNKKLCMIVICAGQKDVMSLYANAGIRGISLNSETANIPNHIYEYMREKCDYLITCYDNDKTGKAMSQKLNDNYAIPFIDISEITDKNDIADYFENDGDYRDLHELLFKITG